MTGALIKIKPFLKKFTEGIRKWVKANYLSEQLSKLAAYSPFKKGK